MSFLSNPSLDENPRGKQNDFIRVVGGKGTGEPELVTPATSLVTMGTPASFDLSRLPERYKSALEKRPDIST
jgi:hypothetical protein